MTLYSTIIVAGGLLAIYGVTALVDRSFNVSRQSALDVVGLLGVALFWYGLNLWLAWVSYAAVGLLLMLFAIVASVKDNRGDPRDI